VSAVGWIGRLDRALGGLAVDLGLYALSAAFAGITAITATLPPHAAWGRVAVVGYGAAAVAVAIQLCLRGLSRSGGHFITPKVRGVLAAVTFVATTCVPLVNQATQRAAGHLGRAQEEVGVVEDGGARLWHAGTPYLTHDAIRALPRAQWLDAYLPYQPGMALFGLPRAVFGVHWWTDARIWFALVFVGCVAAALWLLRGSPEPALVRAFQGAAVFPIVALTLAVGGDDLPVLGLCLLALALAARDRFGWSGVAVGAAGALKLFAWPVALVLIALAATRGRRPGVRMTVGAVGLPVLALLPAVAVNVGAAYENVVRFAVIGVPDVPSPAASPFPGHLIKAYAPGGSVIAPLLLVLAGVAIGVYLLRTPPCTAAAAAAVSACGLLIAILLISATRFGYLLYPIAYACWIPALAGQTARRTDGSGITEPSELLG
jgi:glycosyl transferase family 87